MKNLLKVFLFSIVTVVSVFSLSSVVNAAGPYNELCPAGYTCVSQPSITLKSPNGLEGFVINSSEIPVKWVSNYESRNVKVKLYSTSGVEKFSSSYLDNKVGENTYTISKSAADIAGSYTVKVCDDSKSPVGLPSSILCDSSDEAFMVSTLADISDNPVVERVKSPMGERDDIIYSGESFLIQGKNLLAYASGNTSVYIGNIKAKITQINNNLMWVISPELSPGSHLLYVENENGRSDVVDVWVRSSGLKESTCYRFNTNLSLDTSQGSDDVIALQKFLVSKNYTNVTVNSVFDQNTKQAVIQYQTSIGLPATGFVGPLTRNVLNRCLINLDDQSNSGNSSGSNSPVYTGWKSYDFTGSPYIKSGPISFKYPADWKLNLEYYTTTGGSKGITSISITSPSGIEQIMFSNGGPQATLDCNILKEISTSNLRGPLVCKMINGTPFYLTYTTNLNAEGIYNQIVNSITSTPTSQSSSNGSVYGGSSGSSSSLPIIDNAKYCYTFSKDLSIETAAQGVPVSTTEGVSIFNLQTLLVDKEKINVDSNERNVKTPIFNNSTRQAVIAFQKKYGINPTGYVGPVTRAKLNALYGCMNAANQSPLQTNIQQVITTPQQIISVPEAQQVQKYYQNTTVSNVRLTHNNGYRVNAGSVLQKGQKYTIDWDASSVPESARFTIVVQSPTNPTIYGIIKTGLLGPTKRSFDWTIDTPFIENTDLQIIVQTNDVKASSPIFKVASTPTPAVVVPSTPVVSTPVVSVPSIKSISPSSGLPGTRVTLTLSNPKKIVLSEGDFAFGQYGFTNFTNSNNEVVTFTIPSDAKAGVYDVVWFGDDAYSTKFTVTYPSGTSSVIDWYYPIFGSKSR